METTFAWLVETLEENPIYWGGVVAWTVGFAAYLYSWFRHRGHIFTRLATALCWLGFAATAFANLTVIDSFDVRSLTLPGFDSQSWQNPNNLIWLLWTVGAILIVANWVGYLSNRVGWLGLCIAMTGVVASWSDEQSTQATILVGGGILVILLFLFALQQGRLRKESVNPGDYEAELVRLCHGNKRMAERLIQHELKTSSKLGRAGAALAAVTRLRHERDGGPPPL